MGNWSTGGDLNTGKYRLSACGTYAAALSFNGGSDPIATSLADSKVTEEYNGSAWSIGGSTSIDRYGTAGFGLNTAGVSVGGTNGVTGYVLTEEYNGTAWSAGGDLTTSRNSFGGAGVQAAGLTFGGYVSGSASVITEEYNGTTWTNGGNLNTPTDKNAGCGLQTAGLSFGGASNSQPEDVNTEEYNGTAWSAGGDLSAVVELHSGAGELAAALSFGGRKLGTAIKSTEEYNGTAWAAGGDLATAVYYGAGTGTLTNGLSFGGYLSGASAVVTTEKYSASYGQHKGISGIDGGILFAGKTIIGSRTNGKLYYLDMDIYTDNGDAIKRRRRTQILNKERVNVMHNKIEVEFEAGVGLDVASTADGYDPQAVLRWSDDGGNTWSSEYSTSIGEYQGYGTRALWRSLGKSRNRIYELTITEPVKIVLIGAYGNLKPCKF